jgi:CheY-like chemotaxis protein
MQTQQPLGAVLCDDLMFSSRITGTARALGLAMRVCRSPADLLALAVEQPLACVIVDLHHAELDITSLAAAVKQQGGRVVAFGSHVAAEVLRAARDAGCDLVLPRSQFVQQLPTALPEWYGVLPTSGQPI